MVTLAWIKDALDSRGVKYVEVQHGEAFSAQEAAESEHVSGHHVAKVVVVIVKERPLVLVLPAPRYADLERVAHILDATDVKLASEADIQHYFPDCEMGAVPALRHPNGAALLMDHSLKTAGDVIFAGGTRTDAIRMSFGDWFKVAHPRIASFSTADAPAKSPDREAADRAVTAPFEI